MKLNKRAAWICLFSLMSVLSVGFVNTNGVAAAAPGEVAQANAIAVQFITAEELKAKLAKNEPVAIIDVRGSTGVLENDNKIKGAVYVKLRRLRTRLNIPPLRDVPRDREVVTYCACPNDESSIRAAQMLSESGFKRVRVLKGGWVTWKQAKGPVEPMSKVM
jgi:rhodanese-related sulfurtransferase